MEIAQKPHYRRMDQEFVIYDGMPCNSKNKTMQSATRTRGSTQSGIGQKGRETGDCRTIPHIAGLEEAGKQQQRAKLEN